MARKKERNKGVDTDLDAYLDMVVVPRARRDEDATELQAYIDTPLLDKKKQARVEKREGVEPTERERMQTLTRQEVQEEQQRAERQTAIQTLASNVTKPFLDGSKHAVNNVSHASTSGGIGTLVVVLVVLLFVLVQVDQQGNTRGKMLWYMLNGRAYLDQRIRPHLPAGAGVPPNTPIHPVAPKNSDGTCPVGYILVNGICQSTAGI